MKKLYVLCILLIAFACKKDNDETLPLSAEKDILSFVFTVEGNTYSGTISNTTITAQLPEDTDVTTLTPTITVSKGATVSPNTGVAQNFSKEVTYTVTAENKSTKTYKVLVTTEKTEQPQVPIEIGYVPNEYTVNKAGGEVIFFEVNTLPVKKEQIKVKLLKYRSALSYDLKVQKIDKKERRVYVVLPATYKNGQYRFKATFDKEEVESGVFTLDSSEIVLDVLDINLFEGPVQTLATTNLQVFKVLVYANAEALKKYTYYLRKNGQDYQLTVAEMSGYNLEFKMFNTPAGAFSGGNDFKFVVKGGAKEQVLPFVNSDGQAINIVPTYAPVIKSLSATTLKTGDELTITGENFTYMSVGFNTNYRYCELLLIKNGETKATLSTYNHRGTTATFKIDNSVESGTYKVVLSSQIHLKSEVFGQEVTVQKEIILEAHPRLKATYAKVVDKNSTDYYAKYVQVYFNEDLEDAKVKAIVFPKLKIENTTYFPSVKAISSSEKLSDSNYDYLANNLPKGYVLIEENGKEYKVEFSLIKVSQ
ncbi:DUF5018 domain-containing protein [Capnocytophaga sp. oral taxon 324]|uniref:DUF5018 domain-containing protein n=1 Tax=Capnocytophaga sp. oral taxon 324 TaxID=712211 RepID=UPI0002A21672|nr:DUF5018 domain-containing protein [Capnocytophaga sp. oral taxon 324]EKY12047.1 hypothetical protein HMPREF9072_02193 [Capnocytophaga sp. oral taxon 324 str. F0483]